jgi:hypothetical protein
MTDQSDKRRYGVIEVRRINSDTYHLIIGDEMWSEIEWSASRQRWCVQDAAGHCLSHVEHIIGQDRDVQTAIRLAKRMIVNGEMPTPEEAHEQLQAELERKHKTKRKTKRKQEHEYLGEPFTMDALPEPVPVIGNGDGNDPEEA